MNTMRIKIRGANGTGAMAIDAYKWNALSPIGKVLAVHEALRDVTAGKPFEFVSMARA